MIDDLLKTSLPLLGLYAETHYRFPLFPFSRYYRREPEIIFDAPHRLEPGMALPVTLMIKDANRFPIELIEVILCAKSPHGEAITSRFPLNRFMECTFWYGIYDLDLSSLPPGMVEVNCSLVFKNRGKSRVVHNDNHIGLSNSPLRVYIAADPLPLLPGWQAGELHCHTSYGADYVEFGAPLEAIQRTSEAIGLGWAALTDHSYNLDDLPDDYLRQDPELIKWELLHEEASRLSAGAKVTLLPGEELTVRNSVGRNVHLIILGNREFLHGSGDGAEKWFRTRSEFSIAEALAKITPDAVAIAAHPMVSTPQLEWLLVGRGEWSAEDLSHPRLDGWQIANGSWRPDFERGYSHWQNDCAAGNERRIYAGNDAHGNFNRFRQVRLPMLKLWEHNSNLFGKLRTHLKTPLKTAPGLLNALKTAPVAISDGPAIELVQEGTVGTLYWKTTAEFGSINRITLYERCNGSLKLITTELPSGSYAQMEGKHSFSTQGDFIIARVTTRTLDGVPSRAVTSTKS